MPGYAAVTLSLKQTGVPPGDATSDQMDAVADLADRYSFGELRVSHEQNLIFADVQQSDLHCAVGRSSGRWASPRPTSGCSPTSSAARAAISARSRTPSRSRSPRPSSSRFDDLDYLHDIGEIDLNISGCMNACGHHHVGHIGILGVDKNGDEWYQVSIGGNQGEQARCSLGKVIGPSFAAQRNARRRRAADRDAIIERRDSDDERFIDTVRRIGIEPFKERVYAAAH